MAKFGTLIFSACAAALLIGCGGDGTGGSTGGTTGGATGGSTGGGVTRSYPSINLPTNGLLQVSVLSGLNRRGVGSQVAIMAPFEFVNGQTRIPTADVAKPTALSIVLDEYLVNTSEIGVVFDGNTVSKEFNEFPFKVTKMQEITDSDGNTRDLAGTEPVVDFEANPFDIDLRVFPGRHTSLTFSLDGEMLKHSDSTGVVFDEDKFTQTNYDPRSLAIRGFFSDFIAFDISGMPTAERPLLSTGARADRIFFSGDGIALSAGVDPGVFELLAPVSIKSGTVRKGVKIGDRTTENIYSLFDKNPSDAKVAALTGVWKESTKVISDSGSITALAIPSNEDGTEQQFVVYSQSGGVINAMWQGRALYGIGGDATKGQFRLFPIKTVTSASPSGEEAVAALSNLVEVNERVRRGDWDMTSTPASWPFGTLGGFSVYRR